MKLPVSLLLLELLATGMAYAQQRPDFSGDWRRVADTAAARPSVAATGDAAFRRGDMGSGWGPAVTITQSQDSLIVRYEFFSAYDLEPPLRFAYALDGSESRNAVMIGHSESASRGRVAWEGNTLVIITRHVVPATPAAEVEVRQMLKLESPSSLVVVTTRGGVAGGKADTTRVVYAKR